jgi:hypothetical protein
MRRVWICCLVASVAVGCGGGSACGDLEQAVKDLGDRGSACYSDEAFNGLAEQMRKDCESGREGLRSSEDKERYDDLMRTRLIPCLDSAGTCVRGQEEEWQQSVGNCFQG